MRMFLIRFLSTVTASGFVLGCMASASFAQTTYMGGPGGALVDAPSLQASGQFISDLVISGTGMSVTAFNSVTLTGFTHTWIGDLEIELQKVGTGELVTLTSPPESEDDIFDGTYTFVVDPARPTIDEATDALFGETLAPGSYAISSFGDNTEPGPRETFNIFNDVLIDGTWRLFIRDFSPGDTGSLGSWQFSSFVEAPVVVPETNTLVLALPALGMIGAGIIRKRKQ